MTDTTESLRARAFAHLNHPCYGVDIAYANSDEDANHLRGQGYLPVIEVAAALKELDEYEQSFRLYDDACRRGTKMWQGATGDKYTWPDTAELVAWLLARLEATERLRAEARRLIHVLDDAVPNPGWRTRFLSLLAALAREEASHEA